MRKCVVCAACLGAAGVYAAELVSNPGFEALTERKTAAEWDSFFTREKGKGRVEVSSERHSGERSMRILHDGEKDWALSNARKTKVKPGESYKISCWIKRNGEAKSGQVDVVGYNGDKLVSWAIAETPPARGEGWKEYVAFFCVPEGVDTVFVRVTGGGKTDFWIDDVQVAPGAFELPPKGPKVSGWAAEIGRAHV